MIQITTRRVGPLVIAITVNADLSVSTAIGINAAHASHRLCVGLD